MVGSTSVMAALMTMMPRPARTDGVSSPVRAGTRAKRLSPEWWERRTTPGIANYWHYRGDTGGHCRVVLQAVRSARGRRVQSQTLWSVFKHWCSDRAIDPVSHAKFGKLARWPKDGLVPGLRACTALCRYRPG